MSAVLSTAIEVFPTQGSTSCEKAASSRHFDVPRITSVSAAEHLIEGGLLLMEHTEAEYREKIKLGRY